MDQVRLGRRNIRLWRFVYGVALIALSVLALAAPLTAGAWSLQFLSLFPLAVGLADLYATVTDPALRTHPASYATGILAVAAAGLLFVSPSLVVNGVLMLLLAFLVIDGLLKLGQMVFGAAASTPRAVAAVNGAFSLLLALLGWVLWRSLGVNAAIGVAVAGYTAAAGWRMLVVAGRAADR